MESHHEEILDRLAKIHAAVAVADNNVQHIRRSLDKMERAQLSLEKRLDNVDLRLVTRIEGVEKEHEVTKAKQGGIIKYGTIIVMTLLGGLSTVYLWVYDHFDGRLKAAIKWIHFLEDKLR